MDLETRENLIYGIKNRSREGPSYEAFLDLSGMGNSLMNSSKALVFSSSFMILFFSVPTG